MLKLVHPAPAIQLGSDLPHFQAFVSTGRNQALLNVVRGPMPDILNR